jgi:hypothetical protein
VGSSIFFKAEAISEMVIALEALGKSIIAGLGCIRFSAIGLLVLSSFQLRPI